MRWLTNYFRQVFCKHEFEKSRTAVHWDGSKWPYTYRISLFCPKCGYHRKFNQY